MTTTTDEQALLAAILAAPKDDLPRLVYADWLDDHDRPERAEFIRAQCEPPAASHDVSMRLWELLHASEHWFAAARKVFGIPANCWAVCHDRSVVYEPKIGPVSLVVRRGFVASVRGPLAAFWLEGECGRCRGRRDWHDALTGTGRCFDCRSTGRARGPTPALRELVRREPVERIEVTDIRVRAEIDPPGKDYGWQAYIFRDGESDYCNMNGWDTREELSDALPGMLAAARASPG